MAKIKELCRQIAFFYSPCELFSSGYNLLQNYLSISMCVCIWVTYVYCVCVYPIFRRLEVCAYNKHPNWETSYNYEPIGKTTSQRSSADKKRKIYKHMKSHRTMKAAEIKEICKTIHHGQLDITWKPLASIIIRAQCTFVECIHSFLCAFNSLLKSMKITPRRS